MRLAASNIAWPTTHDDEAAQILRAAGVTGVEIAPTAYFDEPQGASEAEIRAIGQQWRDRGFSIVSLQALLYGCHGAAILEGDVPRDLARARLEAMIRIAASWGAHNLVFGSPKARQRGDMEEEQALDIACEFFQGVAAYAHEHGTCLALEANPPAYQCDFITHVSEALHLVRAVDSPGFRLQIDAAQMTMTSEAVAPTIEQAAPWINHVHASEPMLAPLVPNPADTHAALRAALQEHGYEGWVSLEMRKGDEPIEALRDSVEALASLYGASGE